MGRLTDDTEGRARDLAYHREYNRTHQDQLREWAVQYYATHHDEILARHKQYRERKHAENPEADRARRRAKYARNPRMQRIHAARYKYHVTVTQIEALAAKQGNGCGICRSPFEDPWTMSIDHNHDTGEVRGLLCATCNSQLGAVELPGFLDAALAYLRGETPAGLSRFRLTPDDVANCGLLQRAKGA